MADLIKGKKVLVIYQEPETSDTDLKAFIEGSISGAFTIPSGTTKIKDYAFYGCSYLKSIDISSSVTTIGYGAFYGCSGLVSLTIPNSVTYLYNGILSGCTGLTSLVIGSKISNLNVSLCTDATTLSLTSLTVKATTPPSLLKFSLLKIDTTNLTIYVPSSSVDAYKTATGWSAVADLIQAIP